MPAMREYVLPSKPVPGQCWWCGRPEEPDHLYRLDGARFAGSEPLELPRAIPPDDRYRIRVCRPCKTMLERVRYAFITDQDDAYARVGIPRNVVDEGYG